MKITPSNKRNGRYWINLTLFALGSCLLGYVLLQFIAYPVILAYGYSHPQRMEVCCTTPADYGLGFEEVTLVTSDQLTLRGWYIPSQNRAAVILLHSLASNRMGTLDGARMLAEHGYGVLMLDLRAHGESDGDVFPYGGPEVEDVRAAVVYLQSRPDVDDERIGIMGWSLGAQVGILAAAEFPEIRAVIADGPGATAFEDWPPPDSFDTWLYRPIDFIFYKVMPFYDGVDEPISIKDAIKQIAPRPILLISTGFELERVRVQTFMEEAKEPKELWLIPEANHMEGIILRPQEYEERIVHFFGETLLENTP